MGASMLAREIHPKEHAGLQPLEQYTAPMIQFREIAARSDLGRQRRRNEDRFHAQAAPGLLLVADGLGGHNAGDVASTIAVTTCSETLTALGGAREPEQLRLAVAETNAAIFAAASNTPRWFGMGTTLVAAALCQDRLAVAHVGDSRLYRLRGARLERLTRDHSFAEDLMARCYSTTEALRRAESKALTRALGPSLEVEIDLATFDVHPDDILLLCSDGLTGLIDDAEIAAQLEAGRLANRSLDSQAEVLIALANQRGGHDNITVVLGLC